MRFAVHEDRLCLRDLENFGHWIRLWCYGIEEQYTVEGQYLVGYVRLRLLYVQYER